MEIQGTSQTRGSLAVPAPTSRIGPGGTDPPRPSASADIYFSPILRFDPRALTLIIQYRDSQTGDVELQFPPERVVDQYRQDPSLRFPLRREDEPEIVGPESPTEEEPRINGAGDDRAEETEIVGPGSQPAGGDGGEAAATGGDGAPPRGVDLAV